VLHGAVPKQGVVQFRESGLVFEADVVHGQKTGFFLDQRENRRKIETLAAGRTVLNAFSFSGGFSVYAARGGAISVADIDISKHALASAERNLELNVGNPKVRAVRHESIQGDAFEWLAGNSNKQFDLVILDPPSLAKREAERAGAIQAYEKLIAMGISHLRPRGILLACSCSAHVTTAEFFQAARDAARKSRRPHRILLETGHALDHPARFKEAEYLKAIYFDFEAGG
jgi:23S rRNA (cytosine1962-C5)-methyltransferase